MFQSTSSINELKNSFIICENGKRQNWYYIVTRAVTAILTLPLNSHQEIMQCFSPMRRFRGSESIKTIDDQGTFPLDLKIFKDQPTIDFSDLRDGEVSVETSLHLMPKISFFSRGSSKSEKVAKEETKVMRWLWKYLHHLLPRPDLDPFDHFIVEFRQSPVFFDYSLESIDDFFTDSSNGKRIQKRARAEEPLEEGIWEAGNADGNEGDEEGEKNDEGEDNEEDGNDEDDSESNSSDGDDAKSDSGDSNSSNNNDEEGNEEGNEEGIERNQNAIEEWAVEGESRLIRLIRGDVNENDEDRQNGDGNGNEGLTVNIIDDMMNEDILGQIFFQALLSDLMALSGEMNKRP